MRAFRFVSGLSVVAAGLLAGCPSPNAPDVPADFAGVFTRPDLALAPRDLAPPPDFTAAPDIAVDMAVMPDLQPRPSLCADGMRSGGETDIDCGGPECPACESGNLCSAASDCGSRVCTGGTCAKPSCTDGVKNGGESDVDCGAACARCAAGRSCVGRADCLAMACVQGICAMPTPLAALDFAAAPAIPGLAIDQAMVAADFSGDGKLDLAAVRSDGVMRSLALLRGGGDGTFAAPTDFPLAAQGQAMVAADLDGDGAPDVATAENGYIEVFLADKKGGFTAGAKYAAKAVGRAIAAADLDGDGKLDLAFIDGATSTVKALYGQGAGLFDDKKGASITPCPSPQALVARDLDGDGKGDLAVTCADGRLLTIASTGAAFAAPVPYSLFTKLLGTQLSAIAAADLNGDGMIDLAVAEASTKQVLAILRAPPPPMPDMAGRDAGAPPLPFTLGEVYAVTAVPRSIAIADVNGDGKADLAVGGAGRRLTVLRGAGDGTFGAATDVLAGSDPWALAAGDFDGNGRTDLAAANTMDATIHLLLQDGGGQLVTALSVEPQYGAAAVTTGDWNGDKLPDLALAGASGGASIVPLAGRGVFGAASPTAFGYAPVALAAADLDGDGNLDLAAADVGRNDGKTGGVFVLRGTGLGPLFLPSVTLAGTGVRSIALADFDGTGRFDIASANFYAGTVSILLGAPGGTLAPRPATPVGRGPFALAAGDLDRDGHADLLVACSTDETIAVRLGDGRGGFATAKTYPVSAPVGLALGDLDGDGTWDVVAGSAVGASLGNAVSVLKGTGGGALAAAQATRANRAAAIALADFDLDGNLDAAVAGGQVVGVLRGTGDGRFLAPRYYGAGLDPNGLAVADFDGDGRPDLAVSTWRSGGAVLLNRSR